MVVLTNAMIIAIENATKPLQPAEQMPFRAALLEQLLNHREEIGEGTLGRLLAQLQHRYFRPPATIDTSQGETRHKFTARA